MPRPRGGHASDRAAGRAERRRVGRALQACVIEHDWDCPPPETTAALTDVDAEALIDAARRHAVVDLVHLTARHVDQVAAEVRAELAHLHVHGVGRHLRTLADLATVADVLDDAGVPWLVVKGPVLAEVVYGRAELRSYGDLDVVVPPGGFAAALSALEARGCAVLDRNWQLLLAERRGQVHVELPLGTVADLHWHLVNRDDVRATLALDTDVIVERAQVVSVAGRPVRTTDPVDTLLHLCVHAALGGGLRLRWLKDIERAVAGGVDWDDVCERAHRTKVAALVAVMLARARDHVGADVDDDVVGALAGGRVVRSLDAVVDRTWPAPTVHDGRVAAAWTRLRRDDAADVVAAVRARLAARRRLRRLGLLHAASTGETAVLLDRGGDAVRARFLGAVAERR